MDPIQFDWGTYRKRREQKALWRRGEGGKGGEAEPPGPPRASGTGRGREGATPRGFGESMALSVNTLISDLEPPEGERIEQFSAPSLGRSVAVASESWSGLFLSFLKTESSLR